MNFVKNHSLFILVLLVFALLLARPVWQTFGYYVGLIKTGHGSATGFDAPYRRLANGVIELALELQSAILPERREGLPQVRLYVRKSSQNELLRDLPRSIKNWQDAKLLYADGKLRTVKVRHRGDANNMNFVLSKKSWRVKTKKSKLYENQRVINYVFPQTEDMLEEAAVTRLAKRMGILAPNVRPVELFVNDKSHGILYETQHLDESFLRANNLMAVNLYKGESDQDSPVGVDPDLFQTPALWKKIASNNRFPIEDQTDLRRFLSLVRGAGTSDNEFRELRRLAPYDEWAKFAAFQVMTQSWHNNSDHNQRIVVDDQSGVVLPIAWDTGFLNSLVGGFHFNFGSQPMLSLYLRDSEFVFQKLKFLKRFVIDGRAFETVFEYLNNISEPFIISLRRDSGRSAVIPVKSVINFLMNPDELPAKNRELVEKFKSLEAWLTTQLTSPPKSSWDSDGAGLFKLFIDGIHPIDEVELTLDAEDLPPDVIYLDTNANGRIDSEDQIIPVEIDENRLVLKATFLANRTNGLIRPSHYGIREMRETGVRVVPTKFSFLMNRPANVVSVKARQALTESVVPLSRRSINAARPFGRNKPILPAVKTPPEIWSGEKKFTGISVFDHPVEILPGTRIRLAENASLIFKDQLRVGGTPDRAVTVNSSGEEPWGTFALIGRGASGSIINHLHLDNGSGAFHDGVNYMAMLSVHATTDIRFNGLQLKNNKVQDDMMHIVYSKGVFLRDVAFESALADVLDVDISDVEIDRGYIAGAGNDCLDFMTSNVAVQNLTISGCGDKGISVGEASQSVVMNTVIRDSNIGIESKDRSEVRILHTDLINNAIQINAYKKNWRYGDGGKVVLSKSFVSGSPSELKADKNSQVEVSDSTVLHPTPNGKTVRLAKDVDTTGVRQTRTNTAGQQLFYQVPPDLLRHVDGRRGAVQLSK